jgi:hypothetical protein
MTSIYLDWNSFKPIVKTKGRVRYIERENYYLISYNDGIGKFETSILKNDNADQEEFEANYKNLANKPSEFDVVTALEKNDKDLRTFFVTQPTDENGEAEFCVPVPANGRYVAYGDAEFEIRDFGDGIIKLEIADLDRVIAWSIALAQDPEATEPVSDATVIALGDQIPGGPFPLYPVLGHYDERAFPNPLPENAKGAISSGIGMTFNYGVTEAQPIAGYGYIPGLMYLRIICKKSSDAIVQENIKCMISVDWAEPKE